MKFNTNQNTKIVATVGPASSSYSQLLDLVKAGVDVFRLNLSHGSHDEHQEVINHVLYINETYKLHIGLLADLQGPKLRIGKVKDDGINLKPGDEIDFVNEDCLGDADRVFMSYQDFAKDVTKGEKILVDDGKIVFKVVKTNGKDKVRLKTLYGGVLKSNKGVNLPDTSISLPSMTEKDHRDLKFLLSTPVNWIALSFVRKAEDIEEVKDILLQNDHPAKVIAKIEKPEAVKNIKKIIKASNGIMIARGDLGVEMPVEKLPAIQKDIIRRCIQRARPVIVATQMMDSMIENPSPTRAEVTDVANAVLDGTDAVMLSGETSVGRHPVIVVEAMNKIITEAEREYSMTGKKPKPSPKSSTFYSDVVCLNAAKVANEVKAKAIVGMTISGYTAFKISSYRPNSKIFIFSERQSILATLNLVWGVRCYYYDKLTTTDETIDDVVRILKAEKKVRPGQIIINTGTMPLKDKGRTNMLKVTKVD